MTHSWNFSVSWTPTVIEELAVGDFNLRQRMLKEKETFTRAYDAVIAGMSWESRGPTALSRFSTVEVPLTLFKFQSRSTEIDSAKEAQFQHFRGLAPDVTIRSFERSTETAANFRAIKAWLQDLYAAAQRPLSIMLDITCIPKTYVLFLIGLGFSEELVARIDCLYTPGKYDLVTGDTVTLPALTGPRSLLSEGEWHSQQIPYLEASEYIAKDANLLVTLGGEIGLSLPFIERFEPRRLGLVCIEETSPARNVPMLESERMAYEELVREPNVEQMDIKLSDAVGVARHALSFVGSSATRGTTMMAIGSKPHAVGLALAALSGPRAEVVCRTPAFYRAVDVQPSGNPMLYEIEDRFDPVTYFASL